MMSADELGALIDEHRRALVLYARQWCRTPEDVVQEAFMKLADAGTSPRSPVGYLYRSVRNGAISAARADRVRRGHEAEAARLAERWFGSSDPATRDVADILATLPLEQREVIVAHIWGRLTFVEIAELDGDSSAATLHRRFVEGLACLKEKLGDGEIPRTLPS